MSDQQSGGKPRGSGWCKTAIRAAVIGLVLIVAGIAAARIELIESLSAFMAFGIGLLALVVAIVSGGIGLALSRGTGGGASGGQTWAAVVASIAVILVTLALRPDSGGAPAIHDLTTDTMNPPEFVAIVPLREGAQNPPEYAGEETAELQRQAFPELTTLVVSEPMAQVFPVAERVAGEMGWEIVGTDAAAGRIEAVDTTNWFRFKDDVVVRLADRGGSTAIDVRSKSRVGRGDMGTNARRIRNYLGRLEAALSG